MLAAMMALQPIRGKTDVGGVRSRGGRQRFPNVRNVTPTRPLAP
jgi:hypothetical protein